ncbi:MAG TPA: SDR family oxidoreductase [Kofleriaceae bacterium]|nr:SDR family oxidoreductase [Kofleriaceae bacterium]
MLESHRSPEHCMIATHFVTGATGLVGSAIVLELLQRTTDDVCCLVRPGSEEVTARLRRVLLRAAESYAAPPDVRRAIAERCHAVAGDVIEPCNLPPDPDRSFTQFWHSAASLHFEARYADEIMAVNCQGTARALELAARLGVSQFNHLSTAYVAGTRPGEIAEAACPRDTRPNNLYEKSKIEAEALVERDPRFARRILRPSIVIGHSRTLETIHPTGLYGFMRKLRAYRGVLARTQASLVRDKSLRLRVDTGTELDLIPIDRVAANAVTIALIRDPPPISYFHLSNPCAPQADMTTEVMFETSGLARPTFVPDGSAFDWLDEQFHLRTEFYRTYLTGFRTFLRTHTARAVGPEPVEPYRLPRDVMRSYCAWYVARLEQEWVDLPPTR